MHSLSADNNERGGRVCMGAAAVLRRSAFERTVSRDWNGHCYSTEEAVLPWREFNLMNCTTSLSEVLK
jgi:hypothetical protein